MVMAVNGNGRERIENFGRNWTSRKKLEKWNCDENEQNCDEKEVGRILKKWNWDENGLPDNNWKMKMWRKWTKLQRKRSWEELKKKKSFVRPRYKFAVKNGGVEK